MATIEEAKLAMAKVFRDGLERAGLAEIEGARGESVLMTSGSRLSPSPCHFLQMCVRLPGC